MKLSKLLDNKMTLTCTLVALAGVLLLVFFPRAGTAKAERGTVARAQEEDTARYVQQLEQRLYDLLSNIDGVGELHILVTLESGVEYVYATEQKSSVNLLSDTLSSAQKRVENQNGSEDSYIILKDATGAESPILIKRLEPVVQGVAIVCSGANDSVVRQKLIEATATALALPTTRVSVVSK
ncbi:MAG: hypothetical protein GXX99_05450 [Clostridiales bacterium]|nr:hypothetical protein [Clostridiales bacterium]